MPIGPSSAFAFATAAAASLGTLTSAVTASATQPADGQFMRELADAARRPSDQCHAETIARTPPRERCAEPRPNTRDERDPVQSFFAEPVNASLILPPVCRTIAPVIVVSSVKFV